jgi:hypothetical protein
MPALGHQPAVLQNEDAVGIAHGRKPVGNHQRGAVGGELLDRLLDEVLAFGIKRTRRLVQQQDRRVAQDGARDGNALALAA